MSEITPLRCRLFGNEHRLLGSSSRRRWAFSPRTILVGGASPLGIPGHIEDTDDEGFVARIPGLILDSQASNVLDALNQFAKGKGDKGPVTVWRPSVPGQVCKALTLEKGLLDLFEEFVVLNCEKSFAQLVMESQPHG